MSTPDRVPHTSDVVGETRHAQQRHDAHVVVNDLLVEMWRTALEAGLSTQEAAVVCRVMSFRITDVMDMDRIPEQRRPIAERLSRTLNEEVERARRVAAWEATVMTGGPSPVSTS